jgi:hypothetical protein
MYIDVLGPTYICRMDMFKMKYVSCSFKPEVVTPYTLGRREQTASATKLHVAR